MTDSSHSASGVPLDGTIAVVGGSLAGLRAIQGAREGGFTGRLILIGTETRLPYDRPPLSKQVLAGAWEPDRIALKPSLDELGVEPRLGVRASALDTSDPAHPTVNLEDGSTVVADGVVLATGASPRHLPGTDGLDGVTVLRTFDDSLALRSRISDVGPGCRVVVIGAGFIGSEVAATAQGLGCVVTVLEALPTPLLGALGEIIGGACGRFHTRNGVDLRTGVGVDSIETGSGEGFGRAGRVVLSDGASISADVVVVGIGVVPETSWLDDSGVEISNGVVCDAALFAADRVVAAGDLARWPWPRHGRHELVRIEHWEVASQMGGAAARSLLAGRADAVPFDPIPYFWSDQYGLRVQVLGRPTPKGDLEIVEGALDAEDGKFVAVYGTEGRFDAVLGVSRPRQVMAFRPLLERGATFAEALQLLGST